LITSIDNQSCTTYWRWLNRERQGYSLSLDQCEDMSNVTSDDEQKVWNQF
jgi:hypothetical protein